MGSFPSIIKDNEKLIKETLLFKAQINIAYLENDEPVWLNLMSPIEGTHLIDVQSAITRRAEQRGIRLKWFRIVHEELVPTITEVFHFVAPNLITRVL